MNGILDRLDKFHSLYMNKLERELSVTSSRLSSIESTLRTVADRAVAWDNIQNHMTVWTDQTRTMEKKLDMLNRCHVKQESWESKLGAVDALNHKLNALDIKINAMSRLEFKVEKVSERVEEINSKVNVIKDRSSSQPTEEPGINLLAKRGLVSYLSNVEEKLDKLSKKIVRRENHFTYKHPKIFGNRAQLPWPFTRQETERSQPRENFSVKSQCDLSAPDSQILEDINAKVDLMYDRSLDPDYDYKSLVGHLKRQAPHPSSLDFETSPEQTFVRFWKQLFSPFKKLNRRFKTIEGQLHAIQGSCLNRTTFNTCSEDSISKLISSKMNALEDSMRLESTETRNAVNYQGGRIDKLSQTINNAAYGNEKLQQTVNQQFDSQRTILQGRFQEMRNLMVQFCSSHSYPTTHAPTTTPVPPKPTLPRAKRPNQFSNLRSLQCLPKHSPVWQVPHLSRGMSVCSDGTQKVYRRPYYRNQNHRMSKKTFRKATKNSVVRAYGNKAISKRDVSQLADLLSDDCASMDERRTGITHVATAEINDAGRDYFTRYCDHDTDGGGWTVIQRRKPGTIPQNFTRSWTEYKNGFGDLNGEFWFGNEFIHRLTNERNMSIRFDLWDFDGNYAFAEYLLFRIGPESESYRLSVSGYRGNASDSFSAHNNYLFSTYDRDNDEAPPCCPCSNAYGGGWWFYSCFESNLNGIYQMLPTNNDYYQGIIWELWLGDYSLQKTEMKIRPANNEMYPTPFSTDVDSEIIHMNLP